MESNKIMDNNKLYNENDNNIIVDLSDDIKPLIKTGNGKNETLPEFKFK